MAASSALICRSRTSGFGETVCGLEKGNAMHNAANNTELCMVRTIAQKARSVFLGGLEPPGQILSKAHYYGSPTSWGFVGYTEAIHFDGLSATRTCAIYGPESGLWEVPNRGAGRAHCCGSETGPKRFPFGRNPPARRKFGRICSFSLLEIAP